MPSARTRNLYRELDADNDEEVTPAADGLDKTNDPVRMYLREMGTVPLLTRQGEIEIAKRFERGHLRILKALSRSPVVIREMIAIGDDLERGVRSIKEIVAFDEEELTDDMVEARLAKTIQQIHDMASHCSSIRTLQEKVKGINRSKRAKEYRRCQWKIARRKIAVSRIIRGIRFTYAERERLIQRVTVTVDAMRSLDTQVRDLEKRCEKTRGQSLRSEYKRQRRDYANDLKQLEREAGAGLQELRHTQRQIIQG